MSKQLILQQKQYRLVLLDPEVPGLIPSHVVIFVGCVLAKVLS